MIMIENIRWKLTELVRQQEIQLHFSVLQGLPVFLSREILLTIPFGQVM